MAGAPTPPLIVIGFASGAAGGLVQNPLPVPSQIGIAGGRASWTDGFVPLNQLIQAAGGIAPFIQDMNGVLLAATANIAALTGGQYQPFSSTFATQNSGYAQNAIVAMASGAGFWLNNSAGNVNNPDTTPVATSGWVPLVAYGSGSTATLSGTLTLSAAVAQRPILFVTGVLTGNLTIVFPAWLQQWLIINQTTGLFSVTCKTAAGTGVIVPQGSSQNATVIFSDGNNIQALYSGLDTIVLARSSTASIASNTTPAADSQLITPYLPAGTYRVQARLWFAAVSGGTNPGIKALLSSNAGSVNAVGYYAGIINGAAVTPATQLGLSIGNNFPAIVASGSDYLAIEATLGLTTVGQIYINWSQDVSSASATKLLQGSTLTVQALQG